MKKKDELSKTAQETKHKIDIIRDTLLSGGTLAEAEQKILDKGYACAFELFLKNSRTREALKGIVFVRRGA